MLIIFHVFKVQSKVGRFFFSFTPKANYTFGAESIMERLNSEANSKITGNNNIFVQFVRVVIEQLSRDKSIANWFTLNGIEATRAHMRFYQKCTNLRVMHVIFVQHSTKFCATRKTHTKSHMQSIYRKYSILLLSRL